MVLDIVIFLIVGFFVVESLLAAATKINSLFVIMYDNYEVSIAWENFKLAMKANDPLDMTDMSIMGDMMTIMPKMTDMKVIMVDLTIIFKKMFLRLMLVTACSFKTPVNFIYT